VCTIGNFGDHVHDLLSITIFVAGKFLILVSTLMIVKGLLIVVGTIPIRWPCI
jgi:hypothetical protein